MGPRTKPPLKRSKKEKKDPNIITFSNGKTLSLEAYLANPKPKPSPASAQPPTEPSSAEATSTLGTTSKDPAEEVKLKVKEQAPKRKWDDRKSKDDEKKSHEGVKPRPQKDPKTWQRHCKPEQRNTDDKGLLKERQKLPIAQNRGDIQKAVQDSDVLLLVGETGSGKSTQVPQFLYKEPWCQRQSVKLESGREVSVGGMIAITQPRRVAATTLANRVAREAGTPLKNGSGRQEGAVGYSVRFDHNVPRGTRIKFLTEGMLLQELLQDPNLRDYSAIIVDEIHERSLDVDLLVGFLKQIVASNKEGRGGIPLKVIIMSATADVDVIKGFFSDISPAGQQEDAVQVLRIKGRQFPVETIHEREPVADITDALVDTVMKIHTQEQFPGDILGFLVGQEGIEEAQKLIEERASALPSNVPKIKVVPLFGQMSNEAQREAFMPAKTHFTRKVVLATNIAETSVTVPGVRYVVDGGKAKVKKYRAQLGMESLLPKPISQSSAVQRRGRAGREGPGKCFRLYTEEGFKGLREVDVPEILRTDVTGAVLTMKARGVQDILNFPLIDSPDLEAMQKAMLHLHFLGAVDEKGAITTMGEKMARLPVPVPLAAVLFWASKPQFDCVLEAVDIISCITSGGDLFVHLQSEEQQEEMEEARKELKRREGDIITYLTTMQRYASENADRTDWCKKRGINGRNMKLALSIRRQLRSMCVNNGLLTEAPPADPQPFEPISPERAEAVIKCFLRGFANKTAVLQPDGSYSTTEGKHTVSIHPSSVLHGKKKEAIMFLEHVYTQKNYGKKVSAIQASWILEPYEERYNSFTR
ncbi:ATP-dependent RNA helicase DHR2 [Geosmithia morbida]|uniref:RNA helicase n=1 Tax=Geosmithia morbida TaxID=1094350 RepID=A0A9P4YV13_9HYPO|nr:ATP-dependent RNA helicase DHR2 [Geosmithia morbida]KAF4123330.1 ATP-dependent RNA helicase DHR2 [Geosmithia morbida]